MRGLNSFICLPPLVLTSLSSLGALKLGGGGGWPGFRILLMDEFFLKTCWNAFVCFGLRRVRCHLQLMLSTPPGVQKCFNNIRTGFVFLLKETCDLHLTFTNSLIKNAAQTFEFRTRSTGGNVNIESWKNFLVGRHDSFTSCLAFSLKSHFKK